MGDLRFERPYHRVKQAADRASAIKALHDDDVIAALAAARVEEDPYLANVLASEAMNRLRRTSAIVLTATEGLLSQTVDGILTFMNPAAERLLGWTFEDLRGQPIHDIVHGRRPDGTPYPLEECPLQDVALSGVPLRRRQTWLWRRDGTGFPAEQDAAPIIRDGEIEGVVVALRDVSTERTALESQRASEARFRTLFEQAPTMYMIVDARGRIQATNRFGEIYLGYDRDELVGVHSWELFHPDDRERMRAAHMALFADPPPPGQPREWEARKLRKDGRVLHVREFAMPTRDERGELVALMSCHDLTRVRAAEARERAILESITDAFFALDGDWRLTYINAHARPILEAAGGTTDLIGRRLPDVVPAMAASRFEEEYDRVLRERTPASFEAYFPPIDVWFEVRAFPAENGGISVFFRDITGRHRLRQEIEESERLHRDVVDNVLDLVYTLDTEGRYVTLNRAFTSILGWPREAWIGRSFAPLVHPDDADRTRETLRGVLANEKPARLDVRARTASGHYVALEVLAAPRFDGDRVTGIYGVARDVSARHESEVRLRIRAEERTAELREALQDLETFTNSVSHDLRAPLRGLGVLLDDVLEDHSATLTPAVRDLVERARREGRRAARLVNDILAFSRGGRDPLRPRPVDVTAAARDVAAEVSASHPEWHTRWEVQEGLHAAADPNLLHILLHNLFHNAAKYASSSPEPLVRVVAEERDGARWIAVKDNGVGFAPEEAPRLFHPFSRLSSSAGFEGTGLGLPTAKRIVERHGGRIEAEGVAGRGATFRFTLGDPEGSARRRGETGFEQLLRDEGR